jgi:hypothetical protein
MHNLDRETKEPKNAGYFYNFWKTVQRKQSLIERKFAQSGHPADQASAIIRENGGTRRQSGRAMYK